jgi:predicted hydrocarbon binding protein
MDALAHVNRPELGDVIPVSVFRVFRQFSALYGEDILGENGIRTLFVHAGRELGCDIGKQFYTEDLTEYLTRIQKFVYDSNIGILKLVENKDNSDKMVLQLGECVTCSGMPNIGKKICHFEVGIVAGVVQTYVKSNVHAYETKCNANGDDCCEVTVELNPVENFFSKSSESLLT